MPREYELFLRDMLEAAQAIQTYTQGMTLKTFLKDRLRYDAVMYNLFVIGEAVKNIPDDVQARYADVDWRRIAGLRNLIAHAYFGINPERIWTIIEKNVPELQDQVETILDDLDEGT